MGRPSKPLIVGNWKMYKTIAEAVHYVHRLIPLIRENSTETWLAVPYTAINAAANEAKGSAIKIGAQNVSAAAEGAFTGEISCKMLKEAGASFVIIGHSERRQLYGENDRVVNQKTHQALKAKLIPIVCIGETLEQRKNGQTKEVLHTQLTQSLADLSASEILSLKIAYEPIWAIGTNVTATPEQAQEMHEFCKQLIKHNWGNDVPVLYGGSVKPDNAEALLAQADINGLLVGGSSLSVESFSQIINAS